MRTMPTFKHIIAEDKIYTLNHFATYSISNTDASGKTLKADLFQVHAEYSMQSNVQVVVTPENARQIKNTAKKAVEVLYEGSHEQCKKFLVALSDFLRQEITTVMLSKLIKNTENE